MRSDIGFLEGYLIHTGLASVSFRSLKPREIIDLVLKAGLDGIEWAGDVHVPPGDLVNASQVRVATIEAGLRVSSYGSYYRLGARQARFDSVLETALALGAPTIRVWAGTVGSSQASPDYFQAVVDELAGISQRAARESIAVALELHDDTLTDSIESTCHLVDQANSLSGTCSSYWQAPHAQSLVERQRGLLLLGQRISNIHVFYWLQDSMGQQVRQPLSSGKKDWQSLFETLARLGGDRFALLEFVLNDDADQFLADARTLKRLLSFQKFDPSVKPI